jgi:type IX secretion system PorP/SprF family membrane protein
MFLLLVGNINAQDLYFSQSFLNPLYMNPAYAGTMKVPRFGVQHRNQWPSFNRAFITNYATFDTYIPKYKSGIGTIVYNDIQGDGVLTETQIDLVYSKEIRLGDELFMYGGMSAGVNMTSLNYQNLVFADGIDPYLGETGLSGETLPQSEQKLFPDFSAGVLIYNNKYYTGLAVHHLNKPNQSLFNDSTDYKERKYTFNFEMEIPFFKRDGVKKFVTFNPSVILQHQGGTTYISYGIYCNRKGLSAGAWIRNNNNGFTDTIFMLGFVGSRFKSAVTYDLNLTGLGFKSGGAFEISLSYLLKQPGYKNVPIFYRSPSEWE